MSTRIITAEQVAEQKVFSQRIRAIIGDENKVVCIQTYGCQQNEADSERLAGMCEEMGYSFTDDPSKADLILVNTCAVREHAELKALSITGQFKHLKEKKPSLIIAMCGCMVTQEHRLNDVKQKYPYVDFLFGTGMLWKFPEIMYEAMTSNRRHFYENEDDGNIAEGLPVRRESNFKGWVSIMYGCNNFCTYCVVPYVRGRERSRRREDVLKEVRELVESGCREITLLGQNVNSYSGGCDFADLLAEICEIEGEFIVRFMTSHPKDVSHKLIDTMANNPKIARQFHLPLQSGSNRVLNAMNRRYTAESYIENVRYMREKMPDIALSTDIIVGFPTETDDEFEETLNVLREVRYDSIFSFIYSIRKGTKAADMEGQISDEVKKERFARLLDTQNQISYEKNQSYVGKVIDVLVEGRSKTDDSKLTGRGERGRLVHFVGDDSLIGRHVNVKIVKAETYALYGEL